MYRGYLLTTGTPYTVDDEDVDPDVLVDVEREAKILQAAMHIVMARAQQ
jgi:uncharacterized protein YuzE